MSFYKRLIVPILGRMDSERMHKFAVKALHAAQSNPVGRGCLKLFTSRPSASDAELLKVNLAGLELSSPVMVGAGWDKNARAVYGLHILGFSGVEVGCVVEHPQPGNPKPRQFVISPGVAINRLGFNSPGLDVVAGNLQKYRGKGLMIGVNVGKNEKVPEQDAPRAYAVVVDKLYHDAAFFTINVSCPNSPGILHLQNKDSLMDITRAVMESMEAHGERKAVFIKVSPDLPKNAVNDVIRVVKDCKASGIIATNTTVSETIKAQYGERWRHEKGGLSGDNTDFRRMSTECVAHIYKETSGSVPVIGIGGVNSAETALEKIRAGATAVQLVTGLRGEGIGIANKINKGIIRWMKQNNVKSIHDIIGTDVRG